MNGNQEAEYIQRLSGGSYEVFDYFYLKYAPLVEAFACALLKDKSLSEDICQEVFLRIWQRRRSLRGVMSFKSFLFTIVKHSIYDYYARGHVIPHEQNIQPEDLPELLGGDLAREEDLRDVLSLANLTVAAMPEQRKKVFLMHRRMGMNYQEIAAKTGLSVKTVEYHMSKALSQLKSLGTLL
ncbi:MAG: RNA polymerase sigma-70 factor [Bacteroidales bacterium]|nr:RNA polymerase sigma-70 factor [Bacteroidales bacterium]